MTSSSYYLWKWADNDLSGKPNQVFSDLLRGALPLALQPFNAGPLLCRLEAYAAGRRLWGEEWNWQLHPADNPTTAHFVFLTGPDLNSSKERGTSFGKAMNGLGISGYDEQYGHVIHVLKPKLNCLLFGQDRRERHYDITADEVPPLLHRIDGQAQDPFAVVEDRRYYFVQCYAHKRRFCVEWRENYDPNNWDDFEHWRASIPKRPEVMPENSPSHHGHSDHDTLAFADTVRIFQAFAQGDPKPSGYQWRSIKPLLEQENPCRKER